MRNMFQSSILMVAASTGLIGIVEAGLPRHCFIATELHGPSNFEEDTELVSDLPMLMAMYEPGMFVTSITAQTVIGGDEYLSGLRMRLGKHHSTSELEEKLWNSNKKESLDLVQIGTDGVDWESERKEFQTIDRVSIVYDFNGVCDLVVYDGADGIRSTNMTKDLKNCSVSKENYGVQEVTLKMLQQTPLVGLHGRVDEYGIVELGFILFDAVSDECQQATRNHEMQLIEGMNDFQQARVVEGMITYEESQRAQTLEAILRYDMIQKNKQSKEVTIQKIKNLIDLKPINLTNDGLPASQEDFDELMERLAMTGNTGSVGIILTDEEIDKLYENLMKKGEFPDFEYDGKVFDEFQDLVDYEKEERADTITGLIADVKDMEAIVEQNEDFFIEEYDEMDDEFSAMFDKMLNEEDELADIMDMIDSQKTLFAESQKSQINTDDQISSSSIQEERENEQKIHDLMSWFFQTLIVVLIIGCAFGAACVSCFSCHYQRRQAKRLQEAQMNPAFKFQDTHDPSSTAGGIPASNPIPDEAMQTDTDGANAIATDRGLIDSPDPRRRQAAFQKKESGSGDINKGSNEEIMDNRQ